MGMLKRLFHHKDETGIGDFKLGDEKELTEPTLEKSLPTFEQSMAMQGSNVERGFGMGGEKQSTSALEQEMKLLTSKIDTLIAKMDNMNQRIANIEHIALEAQK